MALPYPKAKCHFLLLVAGFSFFAINLKKLIELIRKKRKYYRHY